MAGAWCNRKANTLDQRSSLFLPYPFHTSSLKRVLAERNGRFHG